MGLRADAIATEMRRFVSTELPLAAPNNKAPLQSASRNPPGDLTDAPALL
jgi:hypothetical protein